MAELAVGMFALALVVSALCGFALYLTKSLKMQNSLRVGANSQHDRIEISDFAAQYVFGTPTVPIHEKVVMPQRTISR